MTGELLIVFEGGERAGKSTQAARLAVTLAGAGYSVLLTREPGGTALGLRLRELLLGDGQRDLSLEGGQIPAKAEALLFAADRCAHVERVIRPALAEGRIVICDRYTDSSVVYQGIGRDLGPNRIAELSDWATGGLRPDVVFVLDIDPKAARARRTAQPDRIEAEDLEFHDLVRSGFLAIAEAAQRRARYVEADGEPPEAGPVYVVLDADRPVDELAALVASVVSGLTGDLCTMAGAGPVT